MSGEVLMNPALAIITGILLTTIICAILLLKFAYKRRNMPGAEFFILLMLSAIFYSATYMGELCSDTLRSALFWFYLEHIPIPIQHYLWMIMSLEYCKISKEHLKVAKYIGLYHPILYYIIFFTNSFHHLYITSYSFESNGFFNTIVSVKGPLFYMMVLSGTVLGIVSMTFYIRGVVKSLNNHRYGYIIMAIASLFPWFAVYLGAVGKNYLGIDYFPVVSVISGFLYIFGIFRFDIFSVVPIATEIVFRKSKEGIMIIDLSNHIVEANDALIGIYPKLGELDSKYSLHSFLKNHPELRDINEGNPVFQYTLEDGGIQRHYSTEVTKITLDDGTLIGRIVTINDITAYIENQKTLESIAAAAIDKAEINEVSFLQAQIKPHFINNILSVIGSMITRDPKGARELIGNLGEYLANCYYFDSSSPFVLLQEEIETINTYVTIEKARFGERLQFQILCTGIPNVNIPRLVLQPLVENAIRHGILKKARGGTVSLIIKVEEEKILFEINDDGVGMSEEMITEILGGKREKQGIGMSNIHMRLLKYYGEGLHIESQKGKGTSIKFSISGDGFLI